MVTREPVVCPEMIIISAHAPTKAIGLHQIAQVMAYVRATAAQL